ncbi:MAG: radical SAM protein [Bacteroidales bacterium]|nr:radical SAM protein [Bacteroidales bacterium]
MYFVNEIFVSLQGEGYWTGTLMVFLRFAGCNLRCPFCDTAHTSPSTPMTLDELLKAVAEISPLTPFGRNDNVVSTSVISSGVEKSPIRRICLTGGEPGLQVDGALVEALHAAGFTIHIETNGTRPLPPGINWITLSPKSDFVPDASVVLQRADELKLVFTGTNNPDPWLEFPAEHHFLQPCFDAAEGTSNTAGTVAYILSHPSWRLSLQTHRLLGLR